MVNGCGDGCSHALNAQSYFFVLQYLVRYSIVQPPEYYEEKKIVKILKIINKMKKICNLEASYSRAHAALR